MEVAAKNKRASCTYAIALKKVVTTAARLAQLKPVVEAGRIDSRKFWGSGTGSAPTNVEEVTAATI